MLVRDRRSGELVAVKYIPLTDVSCCIRCCCCGAVALRGFAAVAGHGIHPAQCCEPAAVAAVAVAIVVAGVVVMVVQQLLLLLLVSVAMYVLQLLCSP